MAKAWTNLVILFAIFALGIFLRTYNIFETTTIMGDTGRDLIVAKHLVNSSAPWSAFPAASSRLFENSPLYFLIIGFLWFLAPSIHGVIVLFAIIQSLVIFVAYYLGKQIANKTLGYYLALFTAVSPLFVYPARWIWQPNLLALFIPLLLLFFLKVIFNKKNGLTPQYLVGFFITSNVVLHLHTATFLLVLTMFFAVLFHVFQTRYKRLAVVVTIIASLFFRLAFGFRIGHFFGVSYQFSLLATSFSKVWRNLLVIKQALLESIFLWVDDVQQPIVAISLAIVFISGFLVFYFRRTKKALFHQVATLVLLVGSELPYIFYGDRFWPHYLFSFLLIFHLLMPIAIFYLVQSTIRIRYLGLAMGLTLIILFLKSDANMLNNSMKETTLLSDIATAIGRDVRNDKKQFSIKLLNKEYGLTDSNSTFNAALWIYLEEELQTELVAINERPPTIREPKTFDILYRVIIDEYNWDDRYTIEKITKP